MNRSLGLGQRAILWEYQTRAIIICRLPRQLYWSPWRFQTISPSKVQRHQISSASVWLWRQRLRSKCSLLPRRIEAIKVKRLLAQGSSRNCKPSRLHRARTPRPSSMQKKSPLLQSARKSLQKMAKEWNLRSQCTIKPWKIFRPSTSRRYSICASSTLS